MGAHFNVAKLLLFPFMVLLVVIFAPTSFALTGTGIEENPYVIESGADFEALHNNLDSYFVLSTDIDLKGIAITPVGNELEGAFTGSLDGQGHTISNLTINLQSDKFVGLFGYLEGSVTNLKLSNVNITGGRYVGGIAGNAGVGSYIAFCDVLSGSITSTNDTYLSAHVGGITGMCEGIISDCTNGANIDSPGHAGGIVSNYYSEYPDLINCTNSGNVNSYYGTGGIIANCNSEIANLINCTNSGTVASSNRYGTGGSVGGMIGDCDSKNAELTDCTNFGDIATTGEKSGGMLGYASGLVSVVSCKNYGSVSSDKAGGMIGTGHADVSDTVVIKQCINYGDIATTHFYAYGGGIIGFVDRFKVEITDSVNYAKIICNRSSDTGGSACAGGMVGYIVGSKIEVSNCKNIGVLNSTIDAGGMVGCVNQGGVTLTDCLNTADIIGSYAGGLIGSLNYLGRAELIRCTNISDSYDGVVDSKYTNATMVTKECVNNGNSIRALDAVVHIGSGSGVSKPLNISQAGVCINGVYCSDLKNGGSNKGFSLTELRNPNSAAYAGWDMNEWSFDESLNSGLPMPSGYDVDYMNKSVLIMRSGETAYITAPFNAAEWRTYDNQVAVVDGGNITAIGIGTTCISAWNSDRTRRSNCVVYVYEPLQSVSITSSTTSVAYNGTLTLSTDVPADDPQGMIWSSSDENVSTVSQTGEVKGKNPGKTIITVYLPLSDISASCEITVTGSNISNLYLYDRTVNVGDAVSVINSIYGSARHAVWTSSDEEIAVVDKEGKVTGVKAGTAMITASLGSSSATCTVTVKQPADSIALNTNELTLEKGLTAYLSVELQPEDCTDTITWTSNNSNIAAVSDGLVTAKGIGKAAITAKTSSGKSASCLVTVVEPAVMPQSVKLSQSLIRPQIGEKIQLYATVLPDESTNKNVKWESSNQEVATVSDSGVVEAIAPGTAVITASSVNGYYDSCQVVVKTVSSAEFVIGKSRGSVGELFDTTVYLIKNPGISAFTMKVDYDNKAMIPVLINGCELLSCGTLTSNIDTSAESGSLYVTWYSAENCNDDGAMFTITWQALEENCEYAIKLVYDEKDVCNSDKEEVFVKSESGSVLILDRPVGDIYKDGEVNMKDIVYFARWFNSQESLDNGQSLAADILYDDILDVKDLTSLAQRLCETLNSTGLRKMPLTKGLNRSALLASDNVEDDNPFSIIVSDAEIKDDENIVLHVSGDNCLGVAAFRFRIELPDGYDVLGVQPAQLLNSGSFAYNPETNIVTWYSSEDKVLNGKLFSVTLRRSEEGLLPATVDLSYSASDFFSVKDYMNTNVQTKAGKINRKQKTAVDSIYINENILVISFSNSLEENVTVFVAFYNENGKMASVMSKTIPFGNKQCQMPYPPNAEGLYCKCFLLSESELLPIADSFQILS